jgi:hypothetical protein
MGMELQIEEPEMGREEDEGKQMGAVALQHGSFAESALGRAS